MILLYTFRLIALIHNNIHVYVLLHINYNDEHDGNN